MKPRKKPKKWLTVTVPVSTAVSTCEQLEATGFKSLGTPFVKLPNWTQTFEKKGE